jgi:hypothetical protein
MKKTLAATILSLVLSAALSAQTCWNMGENGTSISLNVDGIELPYSDHIEMSGEQMSCVLRWKVDADKQFSCERSLVFPMLRRIPNNTHASLMHRIGTDIMSLLSVDSRVPQQLCTKEVTLDGTLKAVSEYGIGGRALVVTRTIFPSTTLPMLGEIYSLRNISGKNLTIYVPEFNQIAKTPAEKGVDGSYIIRADLFGSGTYNLAPDETLSFSAVFQAYRSSGNMIKPNVEAELTSRKRFVAEDIDSSLILDTPADEIDAEFRFAKIRASESIYRTKGGLMHGPGGESYYAALWCNDECEYVSPFYPFLGYSTGNESALNCYRHYARFMNDEYSPIPSSIIAEGLDIWNGAGDRGDAAMIAHGASRYLLARGDKGEAEELWPLVKWCLEYCRRQLDEHGVPKSDSDELEGRFPAGDANLSTACLYYDGLVSASFLAPLMGEPASVGKSYRKQAELLRTAIGKYFSANVSGYETYRYYDGNDVLRSWICLPLCFGIKDRAEGTLAALFSPEMMTKDGILTQQGSETFWDRSTLYALRGAFSAGYSDEALKQLQAYSERRLLGVHVPYPIEAYPEGSQRHLSGESALYCRVITEGLFGIRPSGLRSFNLTVQLPDEWNEMSLRHIKAFGSDFDIAVKRLSPSKMRVEITAEGRTKAYSVAPGQEIRNITL